jgi:hypothetical protein
MGSVMLSGAQHLLAMLKNETLRFFAQNDKLKHFSATCYKPEGS